MGMKYNYVYLQSAGHYLKINPFTVGWYKTPPIHIKVLITLSRVYFAIITYRLHIIAYVITYCEQSWERIHCTCISHWIPGLVTRLVLTSTHYLVFSGSLTQIVRLYCAAGSTTAVSPAACSSDCIKYGSYHMTRNPRPIPPTSTRQD